MRLVVTTLIPLPAIGGRGDEAGIDPLIVAQAHGAIASGILHQLSTPVSSKPLSTSAVTSSTRREYERLPNRIRSSCALVIVGFGEDERLPGGEEASAILSGTQLV